jgi:hypothetical protein
VTPQQAQELAELIDKLAMAHALRATPGLIESIVARLAKLLESVHAG